MRNILFPQLRVYEPLISKECSSMFQKLELVLELAL